MKRRLLSFFIIVLVAAGATGVWFYAQGRGGTPKFRVARVEKGSLVATVSATGNLNAVITVQVGSQVSGQIKELLADFNSQVKKGQLIARIDQDIFEAKVNKAKADLENAQAAGLNQTANLERARAEGEEAEERALAAQIKMSEAQLQVAAAQLKAAQAQVKLKKASLDQALVDLDHTLIRAPVDGTVVSRNVDVGQTVAASLQAPTLFTIAKDLTQMQVDTNVDEADIGRIRVGDRVTFTVDAFPARPFSGQVVQIRKAPQVVQNVVTYNVVVGVQNPDLKLLPGMTANVRIVVEQKPSVRKGPKAALRFRPQGVQADGPARGGPQGRPAGWPAAPTAPGRGAAGGGVGVGGGGQAP